MVELVRIYGANALATVVTISTDFGPTEAALTAAATVILELVQGYSTFPSILRERSSPAHSLAADPAPADLMEP